ncbi:hypothetical protein ASPBRDRAFT_669542 [Aspergillus brasiliensis CBS 101740]|uniref:Uncharacterized protein n=1 Tax=Aspergillus brasiliensis (strain CBS 101740 / IMI 381727 / IBT 21946) TaxID=767769 RepID=A0A1L9U256_ASPBC|nr:hypothetical protein ASPBRDRAFT_669542 [Aspergillus brasiliensis CBS 101740]
MTLLILKYQIALALKHAYGRNVRSPELNPDAPTRPSQIRKTDEFRTMTRGKLACLGTLWPGIMSMCQPTSQDRSLL